MTLLRSKDIWGHTATDLASQLVQIGNNSFAEHGDYGRYVAEKVREAESINEVLRVQPHEAGMEIGSGTGVHAKYFAERSRHLHSFDVSSGFSTLFRQHTADQPNLSYHIKNFFPMFEVVPDGTIDYCYSTSVFCHLNVYDVYLYFDEVSRKLRSGGRLYVNFQNANFGPGSFFQVFLGQYLARGEFTPIPPAEMQFHSNEFFERTAEAVGMAASSRRVVESYSEYVFRKN